MDLIESVAIIIPYFKLTFFEETLESLGNQTDKRFKVYIGDDASPENPFLLLEKFKGKFDFTYHRFEDNLGGISLTKQWDRCIGLSNGERWLMILGYDDVLSNNVIEEFHLHHVEFKNKTNVVRFASKTISEGHDQSSKKNEHPKWENALKFYYRKNKGLTRSSLSEYIFAKDIYLKYGFKEYPLAWYSDDMAWINFSENHPIYTINSSYVIVRISKINITGKKDNLLLKNQAEQLFYRDLVCMKMQFLKSFQKNVFLMSYEVAIKKNRKVNLEEWGFLLKNYFSNGEIIPLFKCFRRFFKDSLLP